MFEKRGWRSACLEQLLLTPPLSMNFFRLKEWREWGVGNLHPFFKNSGAAMGLGDQGPSRQDPAHCRTAVILTVSPFEMYSGGFSKYEDLSNEFSILLQRRVLPCSCQRCSAVCEAQVGGGGDPWSVERAGRTCRATDCPRKLPGASSSASARLSQCHTPALLFVRELGSGDRHSIPRLQGASP